MKDLAPYVDAWIKFMEMEESDPLRNALWPTVSEVMGWNRNQPELLWEFIKLAYGREMSTRAEANLAAGPIEDLLASHSKDFLSRILELAEQDERFNHLLGGVWQNEMDDDTWNKIQRVRKTTW